jgi:hypothetical protein
MLYPFELRALNDLRKLVTGFLPNFTLTEGRYRSRDAALGFQAVHRIGHVRCGNNRVPIKRCVSYGRILPWHAFLGHLRL